MSLFQSTHPLRGATETDRHFLRRQTYFNPRTPCGVRQRHHHHGRDAHHISIHAPLAGCDQFGYALARALVISIHAPLAGCDLVTVFSNQPDAVFQSTHPLRGATRTRRAAHVAVHISIHAPLAGCDSDSRPGRCAAGNFNPRTPCGVRHVRQPTVLLP